MSAFTGFITKARYTPQGNLVPPSKKQGIKWALISAVTILATSILVLSALTSFVAGGISIGLGGIAPGLIQIGSGVISALMAATLALMAKEAINNARHHFSKIKTS